MARKARQRSFTMLRDYTVFNVAQCDGLPDKVLNPATKPPINTDERDATIDDFLQSTHADIREGHGEAYYRPSDDYVSMPSFGSFKNADHFYATAFHELGHWTGHKKRLDRDLKNRFGDRQYAAEELVAELCAAFLCAEFSLNNDLRHAGYINTWIAMLKADSRAFMTAASKAQAAADHLRNLAIAEPVKEAA
jgi:antirestriction protein ArdC